MTTSRAAQRFCTETGIWMPCGGYICHTQTARRAWILRGTCNPICDLQFIGIGPRNKSRWIVLFRLLLVEKTFLGFFSAHACACIYTVTNQQGRLWEVRVKRRVETKCVCSPATKSFCLSSHSHSHSERMVFALLLQVQPFSVWRPQCCFFAITCALDGIVRLNGLHKLCYKG
jgi:hypothetical protein